jgi:plastocyanin
MSTQRISTSFLLAICLVLTTVAATGASASDRAAPSRAATTVRAVISHWSPATVRISRGDTIRWKAVSGSHTVTAYRSGWHFNKQLSTGEVERRIFRRAGTYFFRCTIHSTLTNGRCSGMCGKVVVRG